MLNTASQLGCLSRVLVAAFTVMLAPALSQAQFLELADSNDVTIGPVVGIQDRFAGVLQVPKVVITTTQNQEFILFALKDRFEGHSFLLFQSADCGSQPYLFDTTIVSPLAPAAVVIEAEGQLLYVPTSEDVPQETIDVAAMRSPNGECVTVDNNNASIRVLPAVNIANLTEVFPPPYRTRTPLTPKSMSRVRIED